MSKTRLLHVTPFEVDIHDHGTWLQISLLRLDGTEWHPKTIRLDNHEVKQLIDLLQEQLKELR